MLCESTRFHYTMTHLGISSLQHCFSWYTNTNVDHYLFILLQNPLFLACGQHKLILSQKRSQRVLSRNSFIDDHQPLTIARWCLPLTTASWFLNLTDNLLTTVSWPLTPDHSWLTSDPWPQQVDVQWLLLQTRLRIAALERLLRIAAL